MNLNDLPDINFVSTDIETILTEMIQGYEHAYFKQTSQTKKLYPGDPIRIFLYSQALREFQLRQLINYSAKQNLLAYAEEPFLKHLAADRNVEQLQASKATVPVKFKFSAPLSTSQLIDAGIRVTPGKKIYFEVPEITEIPIGTTEIILNLKCIEAGIIGNDFLPGQINILVDPIPFVESVVNTEKSQGGADKEDINKFRERTRLAPESYSVAGPAGAYEFFVKQYSSSILDVLILSPAPGIVDIRVLLQNGEIPSSSFLNGLLEFISSKDKRPLTDKVEVYAPDTIYYDVNVKYFISSKNLTIVDTIKNNIEKAIEKYKLWQKSKIGRDINPSKLIGDMMAAGASRVEIISPVFTQIEWTQIAVCQNHNVIFGGIEDA